MRIEKAGAATRGGNKPWNRSPEPGSTPERRGVSRANQLLAVLAEDMAALRTLMLAQSRLMAEATARDAAGQAAGDAARRRRWGGPTGIPAAPAFDPLSHADH